MSKVVNDPFGGAYPASVTALVYNRTGATLSKGSVATLDLAQTTTEVTKAIPGQEGSVFGNIRSVVNGNSSINAPQVILLEDIADDAAGLVCLRGVVQAKVGTSAVASTASATAGTLLTVKNGKAYFDIADSAAPTVGTVLKAQLMEATSTFAADNAEEDRYVLFDGMFGFGTYAAS
jgi:hypothetical protein